MLPFEFTVEGPPVSQQAGNRARLQEWRNRVATAAGEYWPHGDPPLNGSLQITVVYYHDGIVIRMDNDNMVKPIQDALIGLVYADDSQITDTRVRKTKRRGPFIVQRLSPMLAAAFVRDEEFIYIRVEKAPDHTELL
jgi:crossover junction endodeoxyribonuclease RusA